MIKQASLFKTFILIILIVLQYLTKLHSSWLKKKNPFSDGMIIKKCAIEMVNQFNEIKFAQKFDKFHFLVRQFQKK